MANDPFHPGMPPDSIFLGLCAPKSQAPHTNIKQHKSEIAGEPINTAISTYTEMQNAYLRASRGNAYSPTTTFAFGTSPNTSGAYIASNHRVRPYKRHPISVV